MSASQAVTAAVPDSADSHNATVIDYDSHSLQEYARKWCFPLGLGEMAVSDNRKVDQDGSVRIAAVPFQTGADELGDHAKYFAASQETFAMPQNGSLQFSADISATTPGTQRGRAIRGHYTDTPDGGRPYAQPTIEGQQAGPRMDTFVLVHGLFSVLDAFPFQHPDAPELAVSVPLAERLFGQGAQGKFSKFEVATVSN